MLTAEPLRLLVGVCLATCVAADAGDDFSNNLFSDLAPLLALFGERVTTQFMSQSMGWADNIILAMAPLGIITAIVGAIRVAGPSWLKAIIGRARESRAVAESELMSSTSNEVCELWNGQEIVRVMGSGPIREFIILLPEENGDQAKTATPSTKTSGPGSKPVDSRATSPKVDHDILVKKLEAPGNEAHRDLVEYELCVWERIFGKLIQRGPNPSEMAKGPGGKKGQEVHQSDFISQSALTIRECISARQDRDPEKALPHLDSQEFGAGSNSEKPDQGGSPEPRKGSNDSSAVIIRNTKAHAPNLTLNIHNQVGRGELYVVAVFGVVLQLGVLVYSGFATYHPTLMLLKDGSSVADYAFPCTVAGTLLLVAGMLTCAHVVESSTSETRYRPAPGKQARVVWLQRSGTVNDQAFESFAIFPREAQALVTTSHQANLLGKARSEISSTPGTQTHTVKLKFEALGVRVWEAITVAGILVSVCGFIVQFIGLRGMHWSASVAQLGATIVMAILRAVVRRNLAKNPESQPLLSGHEMDWLAMTLGDMTKAPWLHPPDHNGKLDKYGRPWADDDGWDWRIAAVENPAKCGELKPPSDTNANQSIPHRVMRIRRNLGELADWHGPASVEAIALARAIEVAMDTLFPKTLEEALTWSLPALRRPGEPGRNSITFLVERRENGNWKAFSDEIEAALSLWLYSIYKLENSPEEEQGGSKTSTGKDDAWLRAKGTPAKPSLRLLDSHTAALRRELQWWMPDGTAEVIELDTRSESGSGIIEVQSHRVVGFTPEVKSDSPTNIDIYQYKRKSPEFPCEYAPRKDAPCEFAPLAVESYTPLKTLYAQHMFTAFMWAAANTMKMPIQDGADVRPTKTDRASSGPTWQSFTLHNARLSKMAQEIQNTGLGSLEEVYLCIIPALSAKRKLPQANAIIEWTREHVKPHEQLGHWKEAGRAYLWLFRTAMIFPRQDDINTKATALLMEYLRAVTATIELRKAQQFEEHDIKRLEQLASEVSKELRNVGLNILTRLMGLYNLQGRSWDCEFIRNANPPEGEDTLLKITKQHMKAHNNKDFDSKDVGNGISEEDIFGWTPLHYAAAQPSPWALSRLLDNRADINARDIRGRTPLHYGCKHRDASIVQSLLREGAGINVRDIDGRAPLHDAAIYESSDAMQSLIEGGADIDVMDGLRQTPLHWAAYKGRIALVKPLEGGNVQLRDHNGRTALHLAAIAEANVTAERGEVARLLLAKSDVTIGAKDKFGRTPLHYAAERGHEDVVKVLLDKSAGVNTRDSKGRTPLHYAAERGREAVVKVLLDKSAGVNTRDSNGRTPLHYAAERGREAVVKVLLDKSADVNASDKAGRTPLHLAVEGGSMEVVMKLVKPENINAGDRRKQTPLHLAAQKGSMEIVMELVKLEANVKARSSGGQTPLHLAALTSEGRAEVISKLIKLGADVKAQDKDGRTPLHLAALASKGKAEAVTKLIELGADIGTQDRHGLTPLQLAAKGGSVEAVTKLVIEGKADVKAQDENGRTVLHQAAIGGNVEVVAKLVELGADSKAQDTDGRTSLHLAAYAARKPSFGGLLSAADKRGNMKIEVKPVVPEIAMTEAPGIRQVMGTRGEHVELMVKLVELGAEVKAQDKYGRMPLHLAAERGSIKAVVKLVELGADVNAQDTFRQTPLHLAALASEGRADVVAKLIELGADVEARDDYGRTPLHLATEGGNVEAATKLVVEGKADVKAQDEDGRTVLHLAALTSFAYVYRDGGTTGSPDKVADLVARLVELGADIKAQDREGQTPLHVAVKGGSAVAITKLEELGAGVVGGQYS